MLAFLQQIRSHFGKLPFLFRRNDRLGLVQTVGDEVDSISSSSRAEAKSDAVWFRFVGLSLHRRNGGYLEGFIELLQIIQQQMGQWPIDRLFLADDPLFKISGPAAIERFPPELLRLRSVP